MKDQWYGDRRDLVKWGVLLELACRFRASRVLQVRYYRPSVWEELEIDGESISLPEAVVQHFRSVGNIRSLKAQVHIDVVDTPLDNRAEYLQGILNNIRLSSDRRTVVFLDPDTGLESQNPGPEHVLGCEVSSIWNAMPAGDVLVFYQHQTNRNAAPWIEPKRVQFEEALAVAPGTVKVAHGPKIARDVAFYFCQKDDPATKRAG